MLNKHYFLLPCFFCLVVIGCKKKKDIVPDKSWQQVSGQGDNISSGYISGKELVLISDNNLYRIRQDGTVAEIRNFIYSTIPSAPVLYKNFFTTTGYFPNFSFDSFATTFNSVRNDTSTLVLKSVAYKMPDSTFAEGIIYAKDMGFNTHYGFLALNRNDSNFDEDYYSFIIYDVIQDSISGTLQSISINKYPLTGVSSYSFFSKAYAYKDCFLLCGDQHICYLVRANGSFVKIVDKIVKPLFVLNDTLYAKFNYDLYKSGDGENWQHVNSDNPLNKNVTLVNNRIINYYGFPYEYSIKTNTMRALSTDIPGSYSPDFVIQFNDYVYLCNYSGVYRKKAEYFLE